MAQPIAIWRSYCSPHLWIALIRLVYELVWGDFSWLLSDQGSTSLWSAPSPGKRAWAVQEMLLVMNYSRAARKEVFFWVFHQTYTYHAFFDDGLQPVRYNRLFLPKLLLFTMFINANRKQTRSLYSWLQYYISLHLLPIEQSFLNHTLVTIVYLLNEDAIASKMHKVHLIHRTFFFTNTRNEKFLSITFQKLYLIFYLRMCFFSCVYIFVGAPVRVWGAAGPNLGFYFSGTIY